MREDNMTKLLVALVLLGLLTGCSVSVNPPSTSENVTQVVPTDTVVPVVSTPTQEPVATEVSSEDIAKSIVKIGAFDRNYIERSYGTGTIIDSRGFILTAFHVVGNIEDGSYYNQDRVVAVYTNASFTDAPELKYYAQVVDGNPKSDLAVLRIILLKSKETPQDCLSNTLVPIKFSTKQVEVGEELKVIGFPKSGDSTLTQTSAKVAGFLNYDNREVSADSKYRAIKLDQSLGGGVSGGAVLNSQNELVGIPIFSLGNEEASGLGYAAQYSNAQQLVVDSIVNPVPGCQDAEKAKLKWEPDQWYDFYLYGRVYDPNKKEWLENVRVLLLNPDVSVGNVTGEDLEKNWGYTFTNKDGYFELPMIEQAYKQDFVMSFNVDGRVLLQDRFRVIYDMYYNDSDEFRMLTIPLEVK
jgi:S1-C subfamily serine protease